MNAGNNEIILLGKQDAHDFVTILGSAHSLVDDYNRQVALFQ